MKNRTRVHLVVLAAVAGLPLLVRPAGAQVRVGADGHAADANNQLGAGGYNGLNAGEQSFLQQTNQANQDFQNNVVTGNVTGPYAFSGRIYHGVNLGAGYTDPFAFRGLLAGQGVDQFIAGSTGVPTMANPMASSDQNAALGPRPFYGAANNPQPTGFRSLSNAPGYVPETSVTQQPEDPRIGAVDLYANQPVLPKVGEVYLPGPVDATAGGVQQQQLWSASTLFGPLQLSATNGSNENPFAASGGSALQNGAAGLPYGASNGAPGAVPSRLAELRQELTSENGTGAAGQAPMIGGARALSPLKPSDTAVQPLQPLPQGNSALQSSSVAAEGGNFSTMQTNRQYLEGAPLPPPGEQSTQYALLQKRLLEYNSMHPMSDEEANQKFQAILKLRQQLAGGTMANPTAAHPTVPAVPAQRATPGTFAGQAPAQIESLAAGVKAKGLANLISKGEQLVKEQQYDKAIAAFNDAIDVAPNNPLILVGRADAELGGGYYRQAAADLHVAFGEDSAVYMGQYDLVKHLGAGRVQSVVADLKMIASDSPDNPVPAFLLAYVLYNSHNESEAAVWVDAADRRTEGHDPALALMKKYWVFLQVPPATQPSFINPSVPSTRPSAANSGVKR